MDRFKIMIVDTDPGVYETISSKLEHIDVSLSYAKDGPTAIQQAEQFAPNVILLDMILPGMDGFEVSRQLRSHPVLADVTILFFIEMEDRESRLRGLEAGADGFLPKPVDSIELQTRMQTIMRNNRHRRILEERAQFAKVVETKNRQLQELSQHLLDIQEAERRFLVRELHDDLGQQLTGLKLMLEMAIRQPDAERATILHKATQILLELSDRVRNLSLDLRPAMLDDFGLFAALEWLFQRYFEQTGIAIKHNFHFLEERRFPKPIEVAAFRIIQESLTNAARYANVNEVDVKIDLSHGSLQIEILDHGRGFDIGWTNYAPYRSGGLSGMRERVSWLDGEFNIRSAPGAGTIVSATFPLGRNASA